MALNAEAYSTFAFAASPRMKQMRKRTDEIHSAISARLCRMANQQKRRKSENRITIVCLAVDSASTCTARECQSESVANTLPHCPTRVVYRVRAESDETSGVDVGGAEHATTLVCVNQSVYFTTTQRIKH